VSKLWRDASKTAAAYPLSFDFDAFPHMVASYSALTTRRTRVTALMDNDEALSLPQERVVGLLGGAAKYVCNYAASRGSVRLLKWERENKLDWSEQTFHHAALMDTCPLSSTCTRNGVPLGQVHVRLRSYKRSLCPLSSTCTENGCPLGRIHVLLTPPHKKHWTAAVRGG
jgi:hypothetical protein